MFVDSGVMICYAEKAEQAQQHTGIKTTSNPAEDHRKKQCRPNEIKPNSNGIYPRKRHNNSTHVMMYRDQPGNAVLFNQFLT